MDKLSLLKKLALAGAVGVGAATLMTPQEAEAAGLETIARKLNIGLEEAAKIKALAKAKVPVDEFEKNIKAIQKVSEYKKAPLKSKILGSGIDSIALDSGNQVLKVPKHDYSLYTPENSTILPSVMEELNYGPQTKTIQTSKNLYQVQDKLNPLDKIKESILKTNPEIQNLVERRKYILNNLDKEPYSQVEELNKQIRDKVEQEFNKVLPEDYKNLSEKSFEDLLGEKLNRDLGGIAEARDLHYGNVGLDTDKNLKVFDTGNFRNVDSSKVTPEMKKRVFENYIASPEQKEIMRSKLSPKEIPLDEVDNVPLDPKLENVQKLMQNEIDIINNGPKEMHSDAWKRLTDLQQRWNNLKKVASVAGAIGAGTVLAAPNQSEAAIPSVPMGGEMGESISTSVPKPNSEINQRSPSYEQTLNNPFEQLKSAYTAVRSPINEATSKIGESIANATYMNPYPAFSGPEQEQQQKAKEQYTDLSKLLSNIAFDPINYAEGPAGLAMGAADMFLQKDPESDQRLEAIKKLKGQ